MLNKLVHLLYLLFGFKFEVGELYVMLFNGEVFSLFFPTETPPRGFTFTRTVINFRLDSLFAVDKTNFPSMVSYEYGTYFDGMQVTYRIATKEDIQLVFTKWIEHLKNTRTPEDHIRYLFSSLATEYQNMLSHRVYELLLNEIRVVLHSLVPSYK